jgi:hypothetical protein
MDTQRVLNYRIVSIKPHGSVPSHEALQDEVNRLIGEGYQPLGQPFFGEDSIYQALVRYSERPWEQQSDRDREQRWRRESVAGSRTEPNR